MRALRGGWPLIAGAVLLALIALGTASAGNNTDPSAGWIGTADGNGSSGGSANTGTGIITSTGTATNGAASAPAPVPSTGTGTGTPTSTGAGTASAELATLAVKGRAPKTGYDREEVFGRAWIDVDHNGCDTRNDILSRDLVVTSRDGCRVLTGTLDDPYTGVLISFVRGTRTSSAVQIDHVVPLMDAWQKGAQQLSQTQRVNLANDPINLLAVDGPENSRKSDGDAATWLPTSRFVWCEYVARQISVKARYNLWVTVAEHDAMARVLSTCPGQLSY